MSSLSAIAYAIGLPIAGVFLVFVPAGRLDWAPGWAFLGLVMGSLAGSALILSRVNPMIFQARSRIQPGTKLWDRVLLTLMLPAMVAEIPIAAFDGAGATDRMRL